ncbi:MAG: hypothetical protein VYE73_17895 [Acidobacteriota bacterium]|nr:hypothetical protein [Acidobacteriota bacterium]
MAAAGALGDGGSAASEPRIELVAGPPSTFRVSEIDRETLSLLETSPLTSAQWAGVLEVAVESADGIALEGSIRLDSGTVVLEPRFRLDPSVGYLAVFRPARLAGLLGVGNRSAADVRATFRLPRPATTPAAEVVGVYPSAAEVPENLLRFYVHFSTPMLPGVAYQHARIENASGQTVEDAFVEIREELWDTSGTRLTLLFDPGRIKRDLRPRAEQGPPLVAGSFYRLVVGGGWRSARGAALADHRHNFRVGVADRTSPDPDAWQITAPPAQSRQPLEVDFAESLDHPQALRWIWVEAASGETLAGTVVLGAHERTWRFTPDAPWRDQSHRLRIDARLEDLAGNRVAEPFEAQVRRTAATGPPVRSREFVPDG